MAQRKRGGQSGNQNAKRAKYGRVVVSLPDEVLRPYYEAYEKKYGYTPPPEMIKAVLKSSLREEQYLHLRVTVYKEHVWEVRRLIEQHLGIIQAVYLLDDWALDPGIDGDHQKKRTIYYHRHLTGLDPDMLEEWDDPDIVTDEMVEKCISALRSHPHCLYVHTEFKRS